MHVIYLSESSSGRGFALDDEWGIMLPPNPIRFKEMPLCGMCVVLPKTAVQHCWVANWPYH